MSVKDHVFQWEISTPKSGVQVATGPCVAHSYLWEAYVTEQGDAYVVKMPDRRKVSHGFKTVEDAKLWAENQIRNWMGLDGVDRV